MDPQVAPEAFDWIILKIAIASMKLKRTVDHRRTRVRCEPLGHGGETDLVGGIFRYLDGSGVQQGAGGLKLGFHVSQRELGCLEISNRLTELIAVPGLIDRLVQPALRTAQLAGPAVETPSVKTHHGDTNALPPASHQIFRTNQNAIELAL